MLFNDIDVVMKDETTSVLLASLKVLSPSLCIAWHADRWIRELRPVGSEPSSRTCMMIEKDGRKKILLIELD